MPLSREQAWFAAKTYGWGWGLPLRWQGWAVLTGYLTGIAACVQLARDGLIRFSACVVILSVVLVAICYWKGETSRGAMGERLVSPAPHEQRSSSFSCNCEFGTCIRRGETG